MVGAKSYPEGTDPRILEGEEMGSSIPGHIDLS